MRTITQHSEVEGLQLQSIIVDDTDTPLYVRTPTLLTVLAGPSAGLDRMISDPEAVALPAEVKWEPVS
ncbi:MAG TPA: hypothetical protein VF867_18800 [Arthrobacter sp.]